MFSTKEMAKRQRSDSELSKIMQAKIDGTKPTAASLSGESAATSQYWLLLDSLFLDDGVLCKKVVKENEADSHTQVIVPKSLRKEVLNNMHVRISAGHLGTKKTTERVKQRFYWYGLKDDVNLHIKSSDTCEANKLPQKKLSAPMGHLSSGTPLDNLAIDFLGHLPLTRNGNRFILVLTDHFTKFVKVIAMPNKQAEECAFKICNEFIARWGAPISIHCDQGASFESKFFKELCALFNMRKKRSSQRNPKGNRQCER